jgi:threonine/homoserine/homoserine lactone efflux protein
MVRYAGAAYLIWPGVRMLLSKRPEGPAALRPASLRRIFAQGVITNVLNPKVALFFPAFLPQFIDPRGSAMKQIVSPGLIFDLSGTTVNLIVAVAAGAAGALLPSGFRFVTGGVFVALGVRLGLQKA